VSLCVWVRRAACAPSRYMTNPHLALDTSRQQICALHGSSGAEPRRTRGKHEHEPIAGWCAPRGWDWLEAASVSRGGGYLADTEGQAKVSQLLASLPQNLHHAARHCARTIDADV
jgi:hypothetical protein